jgi:hypothetical protein
MIVLLDRRIKSEGLTNDEVLGGLADPSCRRSPLIWRSWWTSITSCGAADFLQALKETFSSAVYFGPRVPQGRSESTDPRSAQDERGRSRSSKPGRARQGDRGVAVAAHYCSEGQMNLARLNPKPLN